MSDPTLNPLSLPVSPNDKRPLPEIIAERCQFPLGYHDVDGTRYYAVYDWIYGVAQTSDARNFWKSLKRRTEKTGVSWGTLRTLPYRAADGKVYNANHADAVTLYQITQRMDANTGLRDTILRFLAKSGVILDEIRIDPEKAIDAAIEAYRRQGRDDAWIQTRLMSKLQRLYFTAAFKKSLRVKPVQWHYAVITDVLRVGLWQRTSAELRAQMGLKKGDNVRDHQTALALSYEMLAENLSAYELDQKNDLDFDESKKIVKSNAEDVAQHAAKASKRLGVDIPTNRPLLKE